MVAAAHRCADTTGARRAGLVGHEDVDHIVHQRRHEDRVDRFKIEDRRGLHLMQDLMAAAVASRRVVSAHRTIMDHDSPLDRQPAAGLAKDVAAVPGGVSSCQCGTPGAGGGAGAPR
jgi:hypothetical protein